MYFFLRIDKKIINLIWIKSKKYLSIYILLKDWKGGEICFVKELKKSKIIIAFFIHFKKYFKK